MQGANFIAIDFETANRKWSSICEAGICIVQDGIIKDTKSWYVRPKDNYFHPFNISIHGIRPEDTKDADEFPKIWQEILDIMDSYDSPCLVAHNANFDMNCIRKALAEYGLTPPEIAYYCSLQTARSIYDFSYNNLDYLCRQFDIDDSNHHRAGDDARMCAKLFLQELSYLNFTSFETLPFSAKYL